MSMKKLFAFCAFALFLISMFAVGAVAQDTNTDDSTDGNDLANDPAGPVEIDYIKINGDYYSEDEIIPVDRGTDLEIRFKLFALADADNLRLSARITGLEHGDIYETTRPFEVDAGEGYTKNLELAIPGSMPLDDFYLRLLILDRHGTLYEKNYDLRIRTDRHNLVIKDAVFSPGLEVEAGKSLLVTTKIFNAGEKGESIKVTAEIPELKIMQADFISYLEAGSSAISQELFLPIPDCAEAKDYDAIVKAEYGPFSTEVTKTVTILEGKNCEQGSEQEDDMTFITVGAASQIAQPGKKAVYPVSITNLGAEAKIYSVFVDGASDWGTYNVVPSPVFTVGAGESAAAFVEMTPLSGAAGQKIFTLSFKAGDDVVDQKTLSINIDGEAADTTEAAAKKAKSSTVKMLEILLGIVIVVLIVIALIVAFSRRKEQEEAEDAPKHEFY